MSRFLTMLIIAEVSILFAGCHVTDAIENHGLQALHHKPDTPPADGFTVVNVTATVDPIALPLGAGVVFTTSAGTFLPSSTTSGTSVTVPIDSFGVAVAHLKAPTDAVLAYLTATMNGVTAYDNVQFEPAYPDSIFLATDHTVLACQHSPPSTTTSPNSAKLTVTAWRALGSPTPGRLITLKSYPKGNPGTSRGMLSPAVVAISNAAAPTVTFFAEGPAGMVTVEAQITGANKLSITGSVDIEIQCSPIVPGS